MSQIIRIDDIGKLNGNCKICQEDKNWVLFIDMKTKSSGMMPQRELKTLYEEMTGFTSNGKQLYIKKDYNGFKV